MRLKVSTSLAMMAAVSLQATTALRADTVLLNNGDTLTGTITRIDPQNVDVTTAYAGVIHVKRDAIKTLRSEARVNIVSATGETRTAFIAPQPDNAGWTEAVAAAPPPPVPAVVPVPAAPPVAVPAKIYALNLEPYFLPVGPHWKNQFTLGIVNTAGNTDSTSFASELNFSYKEKPVELTLKFGGVYSVTDGAQTAGQAYVDAVYRRSLPEWDKSDRWYVFAENHELYDAIKAISMRSITSGGLGYYVVKTEKNSIDLRAGPAFVWQRMFGGETHADASGLAGLRAVHTINDHVSLSQEILYTVAFSDMDRYQITGETALNVKLPEVARGLGMKLAFRDDYDNSTTAPRKHNDTRLTLAMTMDF